MKPKWCIITNHHPVHYRGMKNRIAEIRRMRGLSQEALGEMVDTSRQQIYRLESGHRRLTQTWMEKLAEALGVEPIDLLPIETNAMQEPILAFNSAPPGPLDEDAMVYSIKRALRDHIESNRGRISNDDRDGIIAAAFLYYRDMKTK